MITVLFHSFFSQTAIAAPIRVAVESSSSSSATSMELAAQLNDDTRYDFDATVVVASDIDSATELAAYDVVILGDSGQPGRSTSAMASALATWTSAGNGGFQVGWVTRSPRPGRRSSRPLTPCSPSTQALYHAWGSNSNGGLVHQPSGHRRPGRHHHRRQRQPRRGSAEDDATNRQVRHPPGLGQHLGTNAIVVGEYGAA